MKFFNSSKSRTRGKQKERKLGLESLESRVLFSVGDFATAKDAVGNESPIAAEVRLSKELVTRPLQETEDSSSEAAFPDKAKNETAGIGAAVGDRQLTDVGFGGPVATESDFGFNSAWVEIFGESMEALRTLGDPENIDWAMTLLEHALSGNGQKGAGHSSMTRLDQWDPTHGHGSIPRDPFTGSAVGSGEDDWLHALLGDGRGSSGRRNLAGLPDSVASGRSHVVVTTTFSDTKEDGSTSRYKTETRSGDGWSRVVSVWRYERQADGSTQEIHRHLDGSMTLKRTRPDGNTMERTYYPDGRYVTVESGPRGDKQVSLAHPWDVTFERTEKPLTDPEGRQVVPEPERRSLFGMTLGQFLRMRSLGISPDAQPTQDSSGGLLTPDFPHRGNQSGNTLFDKLSQPLCGADGLPAWPANEGGMPLWLSLVIMGPEDWRNLD